MATTMTIAQSLFLEDGLRDPEQVIRKYVEKQAVAAMVAKGWITAAKVVTAAGADALRDYLGAEKFAVRMAVGREVVVVQDAGGQVPGVFTSASMVAAVEMGKLTGRMEMAHFYETVSAKVMVETYIQMKEGKKYLGLPYTKKDGTNGNVSDLEEFCEAYLGKTYRRVRQLEQAYHMLGADLYEKAETIGMSSRDYAAIRALPAEDQEILKGALREEDKDKILSTMEDLILKHRREKAEVDNKIKELSTDAAAKGDRLAEVGKDLERTKLELHKIKNYTPAEQAESWELQLTRELQSKGNQVDLGLAQLSAVFGDYLQEGVTEAKEAAVLGLMAFLGERFNEVLREHQIRLNFQDIVNPPYEIDLFGKSMVVRRRANGE